MAQPVRSRLTFSLANDPDVDGGSKRVNSVKTTGTNGVVKIMRAGSGLRYQPSADYCTATVSVTVSCVDG
jgi:hypothetical protein